MNDQAKDEAGGEVMAGIRVGKPDVAVDATAHTPGVEQGNSPKKQVGLNSDGTGDERRSTGIQPKKHNPISSAMPNIPPS
jgi:hypothetical protein